MTKFTSSQLVGVLVGCVLGSELGGVKREDQGSRPFELAAVLNRMRDFRASQKVGG